MSGYRVRCVTLFPERVAAVGEYGVTGRAVQGGLVDLACINPRDFTEDAHRTVDDRPFGGGPGMVMKYEPVVAAIRAARAEAPGAPCVLLSPQGRPYTQAEAERLAALPGLVLVAGRYEGLDERIVEAETDEELSLGDFVLSGGELAAMVVIDSVARLLPGVLGHDAAIARWRRKQALGRTWQRRPDLLAEATLSREDEQLLEEYRAELQAGPGS